MDALSAAESNPGRGAVLPGHFSALSYLGDLFSAPCQQQTGWTYEQAMLFGVGAAEVRVFVAILVVVAATAALIPAIRASRIHPSDALRHE